MKELSISTEKPYKVIIGLGLIARLGEFIGSLDHPPQSVMIVTDSNVGPLYAERAKKALSELNAQVIEVPAGEEYKTPETVLCILHQLAKNEFTRDDLVFALGGGVIGDMSGFAAAIYQRGMRFAQCPTTLLSAVDASVGGKTAVDLPEGKNLIGAFHQPSIVICDTDTFSTLPENRIADGAAEIIKHAVIADKALFEELKCRSWPDHMENIVAQNVMIKRSFVLDDEKDLGKRQTLNFGHTIGHAIEAWSRFSLSHGQSVAIGMVMETRAARCLGLSDWDEQELVEVLKENELPTETNAKTADILEYMIHDKKRKGRGITIAVPVRIGETRLEHINLDRVKEYIEAGQP